MELKVWETVAGQFGTESLGQYDKGHKVKLLGVAENKQCAADVPTAPTGAAGRRGAFTWAFKKQSETGNGTDWN